MALPQKSQEAKTFANISLEEFAARLERLDLEPIVVKLMDEKEGEGWTLEQADLEVERYKQFLYLNFKYSEHEFVPTHNTDTVWHYHVFDTQKYSEDCVMLFSTWYQRLIANLLSPILTLIGVRIYAGAFFNHFPYFGMRGEEDKRNLGLGYMKTQEYYMKEFNVSILPNNGTDCIKSCH